MDGSTKKLKRQMKIKTQLSKIIRMQQSCLKRENYSNIGVPQEARNILNKQPNLTLKGAGK